MRGRWLLSGERHHEQAEDQEQTLSTSHGDLRRLQVSHEARRNGEAGELQNLRM